MIHQAHIFISGFVHGVGYRHFVRKNAQKLGLTGWVRNLPDNRVEALIQSSASRRSSEEGSDQEAKEKIEELIVLCRKGPFLAEVEDVSIVWEEPKEKFAEFKLVIDT